MFAIQLLARPDFCAIGRIASTTPMLVAKIIFSSYNDVGVFGVECILLLST